MSCISNPGRERYPKLQAAEEDSMAAIRGLSSHSKVAGAGWSWRTRLIVFAVIGALATLAVAGGLIASNAAGADAGSQAVVLTDSGFSTAPSDSTVGSAHDYTHRTNTFSTGAD